MIKPITLLILCLASASASGMSLVVPNGLDVTDGNSFGNVPFNAFPGTSMRYQQVYHASQFDVFRSEGAWITHVAFRPDVSAPGFAATLPNVQIALSTTSMAPDAMSTIFNDNVGADNLTVFSGSISLAGGVWQFIALQAPFLYLPSTGNLLLDVKNFNGVTTVPFDGVLTEGDSVSALYAYPGDNSGDVFSTSGRLSTFGYATVFNYTPVPEPGAISLIAIGVCGLGLVQWRRKANGKLRAYGASGITSV